MSLIADALKKVQRERMQGERPDGDYPTAADSGALRRKRFMLYAAVPLIILIGSGLLVLRFDRSGSARPALPQPAAARAIVAAVGHPTARQNRDMKASSKRAVPTPPARTGRESHAPQPDATPVVKSHVPVVEPATTGSDELMRQGEALENRGEELLAIEKYRQALAVRPTPEAYVRIYSVLQKQDNAALARVYVQEGVNAFPDHLQLNKILVNLNIRERRFGAALERIEKCGVQDAALLTYRGLCRFHLGDFDRAMADFRSSLGWDGAAVENYYYMGLIFDNRKEYPQALLHYRRFLELNPENRYFRHRQWIVERMQMLQKAFNSDGRP